MKLTQDIHAANILALQDYRISNEMRVNLQVLLSLEA
jgi:hypothetical protein